MLSNHLATSKVSFKKKIVKEKHTISLLTKQHINIDNCDIKSCKKSIQVCYKKDKILRCKSCPARPQITNIKILK